MNFKVIEFSIGPYRHRTWRVLGDKPGRRYVGEIPPMDFYSKKNRRINGGIVDAAIAQSRRKMYAELRPYVQKEYAKLIVNRINEEFVFNIYHHSNQSKDESKPMRWGYGLNSTNKHGVEFYVFFKSNDVDFAENDLSLILERYQQIKNDFNVHQGRGLGMLKETFPESKFSIEMGNYDGFNYKKIFSFIIPFDKLVLFSKYPRIPRLR